MKSSVVDLFYSSISKTKEDKEMNHAFEKFQAALRNKRETDAARKEVVTAAHQQLLLNWITENQPALCLKLLSCGTVSLSIDLGRRVSNVLEETKTCLQIRLSGFIFPRALIREAESEFDVFLSTHISVASRPLQWIRGDDDQFLKVIVCLADARSSATLCFKRPDSALSCHDFKISKSLPRIKSDSLFWFQWPR